MFGFWGEHLYGERCAVGGVQLWAPKTTNLMTLHLTYYQRLGGARFAAISTVQVTILRALVEAL